MDKMDLPFYGDIDLKGDLKIKGNIKKDGFLLIQIPGEQGETSKAVITLGTDYGKNVGVIQARDQIDLKMVDAGSNLLAGISIKEQNILLKHNKEVQINTKDVNLAAEDIIFQAKDITDNSKLTDVLKLSQYGLTTNILKIKNFTKDGRQKFLEEYFIGTEGNSQTYDLSNINDFFFLGTYNCNGTNIGAPYTGAKGTLYVTKYGATSYRQFFIPNSSQKIFSRFYIDNIWEEWQLISGYDTANYYKASGHEDDLTLGLKSSPISPGEDIFFISVFDGSNHNGRKHLVFGDKYIEGNSNYTGNGPDGNYTGWVLCSIADNNLPSTIRKYENTALPNQFLMTGGNTQITIGHLWRNA